MSKITEAMSARLEIPDALQCNEKLCAGVAKGCLPFTNKEDKNMIELVCNYNGNENKYRMSLYW